MIDVAGHGDRCGAGAVVLAEEVPDVGGPIERTVDRPPAVSRPSPWSPNT